MQQVDCGGMLLWNVGILSPLCDTFNTMIEVSAMHMHGLMLLRLT